jgi:hypothetical protein
MSLQRLQEPPHFTPGEVRGLVIERKMESGSQLGKDREIFCIFSWKILLQISPSIVCNISLDMKLSQILPAVIFTLGCALPASIQAQESTNTNLVYNTRSTTSVVGAMRTTDSEGQTTIEYRRSRYQSNGLFLLGPTFNPAVEWDPSLIVNRTASFSFWTSGQGRNRVNYFSVYENYSGHRYQILQLDSAGRNLLASIGYSDFGKARLGSPARGLQPVYFAQQLQGQYRSAYDINYSQNSSNQPQPGTDSLWNTTYRLDASLTSLVYQMSYDDALDAIRQNLLARGYQEYTPEYESMTE